MQIFSPVHVENAQVTGKLWDTHPDLKVPAFAQDKDLH